MLSPQPCESKSGLSRLNQTSGDKIRVSTSSDPVVGLKCVTISYKDEQQHITSAQSSPCTASDLRLLLMKRIHFAKTLIRTRRSSAIQVFHKLSGMKISFRMCVRTPVEKQRAGCRVLALCSRLTAMELRSLSHSTAQQ